MNLLIGIDPGSGVSSPTGFVGIDADTKEILWHEAVGTQHKKLEHRIKEISDCIEMWLINMEQGLDFRKDTVLVCVESFLIRGKGGETLQRLIGSLMGRVPYNFEVTHVANTRMKLVVGGSGKADKEQVGRGVLAWFKDDNAMSARLVGSLIAQREWDIVDALGLAIAGHELRDEE